VEAGLKLERIGADQIREWEPAVNGSVRRGIWWPFTAQIDNRKFIEAYRRIVEGQGGRIRTGTPVSRFLIQGDRVVGAATPSGPVKADWVVNCAGSWAGFDDSFPLAIPVVPVKGQMIQFRTEVPLFSRIVKSPRAYLVQRASQQLIAGTTVERAGYDKAVTEEGQRSIRQGVGEITSCLDSGPEEAVWAGLRPGTPDRLPVLGPTPFKRLLLATGHYRNGILLAPLTGRLIADWIMKGVCSMDLTPFHVSRFLARQEKEGGEGREPS